MLTCAVKGCKNKKGGSKAFFPFPSSDSHRVWVSFCQFFAQDCKWQPSSNDHLCEEHFLSENIISIQRGDDKKYDYILDGNAVPCIAGSLSSEFIILPHYIVDISIKENSQTWTLVWDTIKKSKAVPNDNWLRARTEPCITVSVPVGNKIVTKSKKSLIPIRKETIRDGTIEENNDNQDHNSTSAVDDDAESSSQINFIRQKKLEKSLKCSQQKVRELNIKCLNLNKKYSNLEKNLKKFLNEDQIKFLENTSTTNPRPWTEETIKTCLQIKFEVGNLGYECLRKRGWPLPCNRTLSRRVENCLFQPGIQKDIVDALGEKLSSEDRMHHLVVKAFDEMEISAGPEMCRALGNQVIGLESKVLSKTFDSRQPASKVLAFIDRGLALHYKQVVAYDFVGKSTDPVKMWDFISLQVRYEYERGIVVKVVSTDMGPCNTGIWNHVNVGADRTSVRCKVVHPADQSLYMYFTADVTHLMKNTRSMIIEYDFFIPLSIFKEFQLPTRKVSFTFVEQLFELQRCGGPVLVEELTTLHIDPNNLMKMRVLLAALVFSPKTCAALRECVRLGLIHPDALTTAFFLQLFNTWYSIMTSRKRENALHKADYEDKISHLELTMRVFRGLTFSGGQSWKPIQTGVIIATTTIIELHKELVLNGPMEYLLTSRLTTESVENLFSQVRGGGVTHPGPNRVRERLKAVSIAQYTQVPKGSNYESEDSTYLLDFFKYDKSRKEKLQPPSDLSVPLEENKLHSFQLAGVYTLSGWVARQLKKKLHCETCKSVLSVEIPDENLPYHFVADLAANSGFIQYTHPSKALYDIIFCIEKFFDSAAEVLHVYEKYSDLLTTVLRKTITTEMCSNIPQCHFDQLITNIIKQYCSKRIHIFNADKNRKPYKFVSHAGKSAYMVTAATTYGSTSGRKKRSRSPSSYFYMEESLAIQSSKTPCVDTLQRNSNTFAEAPYDGLSTSSGSASYTSARRSPLQLLPQEINKVRQSNERATNSKTFAATAATYADVSTLSGSASFPSARRSPLLQMQLSQDINKVRQSNERATNSKTFAATAATYADVSTLSGSASFPSARRSPLLQMQLSQDINKVKQSDKSATNSKTFAATAATYADVSTLSGSASFPSARRSPLLMFESSTNQISPPALQIFSPFMLAPLPVPRHVRRAMDHGYSEIMKKETSLPTKRTRFVPKVPSVWTKKNLPAISVENVLNGVLEQKYACMYCDENFGDQFDFNEHKQFHEIVSKSAMSIADIYIVLKQSFKTCDKEIVSEICVQRMYCHYEIHLRDVMNSYHPNVVEHDQNLIIGHIYNIFSSHNIEFLLNLLCKTSQHKIECCYRQKDCINFLLVQLFTKLLMDMYRVPKVKALQLLSSLSKVCSESVL